MGKLRSDSQRSTQYERQKAVDEAWAKEVELVRQGKGTRNWSADEQKELLSTGKVNGYYGHHMSSVKNDPANAGNKDNIQFLNYDEHIHGAHQGDTKNATNGYYDPETGQMHTFQNGVEKVPERDIENGFESEAAREEAYKQGMVDRNNAKIDKEIADYEKKLEQRENLTDEEKREKLSNYQAKKESEKEEYKESIYGEKSENEKTVDEKTADEKTADEESVEENLEEIPAETVESGAESAPEAPAESTPGTSGSTSDDSGASSGSTSGSTSESTSSSFGSESSGSSGGSSDDDGMSY